MELFIHLGKSVGILIIFYTVYLVALRKNTFFTAKRHFLITGIVTAIALPFIEFTKTVTIVLPSQPTTSIVENSISFEAGPLTQMSPVFTPDWWLVAAVFYGIGILILLCWLGHQLFFLSRLIQSGTATKEQGYTFIKVNQDVAPFSFFTYIVYNPALHTQSELEMILAHEQIHARQWHSLDMLLTHLALALHWCNPIAWMYKKSIEENLEFIADSEAVEVAHCKQTYQRTLVKVSSAQHHPALTNPFYKSFIKKRIVMLNTPQSRKHNLWKLGLVLPLLALFMYSFNVKEVRTYVEEDNSASAKASKSSTSKMEIAGDTTNTGRDLFYINQESSSNTLDNLERYVSDHWDDITIKFDQRIFTPAGKLSGFHFQTKFKGDTQFVNRFSFGNETTKNWEGYSFMVNTEDEIIIMEQGNGSLFKITPDHLIESNGRFNITEQRLELDDTYARQENLGKDPVIILNGETQMNDQKDKRYRTDSISTVSPSKAIIKYGSIARDGALILHNNKPQEVSKEKITIKSMQDTYRFTITKNTTIEELKLLQEMLKNKHNASLTYGKIDYNEAGEMTSIRLDFKDANGNNKNYSIHSDVPIADIYIYRDEDGRTGMGNVGSSEELELLRQERRENMEARREELKLRGKAMRVKSDSLRAGMMARRDSVRAFRLIHLDSARGTARFNVDSLSKHSVQFEERRNLTEEKRLVRRIELQEQKERLKASPKLKSIQKGHDSGSLTLKDGKTYYFVLKDGETVFYNRWGEKILENDETHKTLKETLRGINK